MRTADQVKRKYNELAAQRKSLEEQAARLGAGAESSGLQARIDRLDEQMMLLEWVLDEPMGSYHG